MLLKRFIQLAVVLLIAFGSIFIWEKAHNLTWFGIKDVRTTHRVVLEKMTTLGKIELSKFTFKDIVEQELVRDFLPNPKALLIVQGEAIGCIDLQKVTENDIHIFEDSMTIALPSPEICTFRIDHEHSKIYQTDYAFMNEQLLLDEAYKKAESQIYKSALDAGILEQTRKNAELVLKPLFENISSRKVVLTFK